MAALRSYTLVALQIALIAVLALPWRIAGWNTGGSALVAIGIALGLWALTANRPGNFNIRPEPRAGGHLVTDGPYRFVRHPMYLAVLIVAAGCALGYADIAAWRREDLVRAALWLT